MVLFTGRHRPVLTICLGSILKPAAYLLCYGSACYGEIFDALGTDIVTASMSPVKRVFSESLQESGIGLLTICPFGQDRAL